MSITVSDFVIPAQAGIHASTRDSAEKNRFMSPQTRLQDLDSRLRGNDDGKGVES
jgi:hypothetical protein